ncbi:hypothetical protein HQ520_07785 [bacterium]|nr:hypothetical protein [bacterium]
MSFEDGMAAMTLQTPGRIPRFEPSAAEYHYDLVRAVTGLNVTQESTEEEKTESRQAFLRAWDYGIYLNGAVWNSELDAMSTSMGHANYAANGADFDGDLSCPFKDVEEVYAFDPYEAYGSRDHAQLVKRFTDHYHCQCKLYPDTVNTTGIYITLMSAMIKIFGWDMLLTAAGMDAKRFGDVVTRYGSWIQQYYSALADSDAEVIYSHDDLVWSNGPFIHPDWYREFIFPNLKKLWAPLREAGKKIIFVCDGDYGSLAADVAACGNHGFWFEIFTDLNAMAERFGQSHVLIGNADCRVLTFGSKADIRVEVERCMAAGKKCPGYFMCVSGHIPPNVPVENALYYNEVYMQLRTR